MVRWSSIPRPQKPPEFHTPSRRPPPLGIRPHAALASLEVDLHPRGVKYLFTTPRGEAEVTAQAVSDSLVGRLVRLAGLLALVAVLWALIATVRRRQQDARSLSRR